LATVAILTWRYPGVTVVLARMILHERFSLAQRTGLGLAAIAVVAIALN
jgi:EamA domain-containing membrane protein RarD